MPEVLRINNEGVLNNVSQSEILSYLRREDIDQMIKDPSQTFRGLSHYSESDDDLDGLIVINEGKLKSRARLAPEDCSDVILDK